MDSAGDRKLTLNQQVQGSIPWRLTSTSANRGGPKYAVQHRLTEGLHYEAAQRKLDRLTPKLRQDVEFYFLSLRGEGRKPTTIRGYRQNLAALCTFLDVLGVTAAEDITSTHLRLWLLDLEARMKPVSVRDYYVAARAWLHWLYRESVIPVDPSATLRPPKAPKKVVATFEATDIERMADVCDWDAKQDCCEAWLGLRNKAMLLVFVDSGVRESELTHMRLAHFIMDYTRIKVVDTKNGEERVVAIHPKTQKAVLRYLLVRRTFDVGHDFVWVGRRGTALLPNGVYQALRGIGTRAGVSKERFIHAMRHTAATMSLLNNATPREVQDMLGEKTPAMVNWYTATIGSEQAAERHREWSPVSGLHVT